MCRLSFTAMNPKISVVVLHNTTYQNEGVYQCVVVNQAGSDISSAILTVTSEAYIKSHS